MYVTRGFNILCQIMVTFLSYISNACHSLSGVAERLQHTSLYFNYGRPLIHLLTQVILVRVACGSNIRHCMIVHIFAFVAAFSVVYVDTHHKSCSKPQMIISKCECLKICR